jgi:hypothetical protein
MSKVASYVLALIVLLTMPFAKINSQEQKQEKKSSGSSVSMDMDDVASSRNNSSGATVRKGATNQFEFRSLGGDFIGQNLMRSYKAGDGWFKARADYQFKTKEVRTVRIEFADQQNRTFRMSFSIPKKNYGFVPGTYQQAVIFINDSNEESPAMSVSFDSRGCSRVNGEFIIYEAEFDTSGTQPKVISFSASFSQQCTGKGVLEGSIYFNAVPPDAAAKIK